LLPVALSLTGAWSSLVSYAKDFQQGHHHDGRHEEDGIVCNIGHFDNEIDMQDLETYKGVKRITMKL
jgi:hypothetical protein